MAAKSTYPNNVTTPPVHGKKAHAGKAGYPQPVHTKAVAGSAKLGYPNKKKTAAAPSIIAPAGPSKSNVDPKVVSGILGGLKMSRR